METKSGCAWIALTLLTLLLGACENPYRSAADDPQLTVTIPVPVSSGAQRVAYAVAPAYIDKFEISVWGPNDTPLGSDTISTTGGALTFTVPANTALTIKGAARDKSGADRFAGAAQVAPLGAGAKASVTLSLEALNPLGVAISSEFDPNNILVTEGTLHVTVIPTTAASDQALGYRISGGADRELFTIDPLKGELSFVTPPRFDINQDNLYEVQVEITDGFETAVKDLKIIVLSQTQPRVGRLNDTGVTAAQCYEGAHAGNVGGNTLVACNTAGATALNDAQDGMKGRDADPITNDNADGKLGFSFSTVAGGCVQDNITGLMWEVKTAGGAGDLRDLNKTYTNQGSDAATDTSGFVTAVNAVGLCGFNDWRLPSVDELQSIVDYGAFNPSIDATWFPNTIGGNSGYWSSSPYVGSPAHAWVMGFGTGIDNNFNRSSAVFVRLVRGDFLPPKSYLISADGQEVTDPATGLIWRRCAEGLSWDGASCTGIAITFDHAAALARARSVATNSGLDWRLPNVKELTSIADKNLQPAINGTAFPATPLGFHWSSSPYAERPVGAWVVHFNHGYVNNDYRSTSYYVRLVRAGQ